LKSSAISIKFTSELLLRVEDLDKVDKNRELIWQTIRDLELKALIARMPKYKLITKNGKIAHILMNNGTSTIARSVINSRLELIDGSSVVISGEEDVKIALTNESKLVESGTIQMSLLNEGVFLAHKNTPYKLTPEGKTKLKDMQD
jgi:hypothetical protein